MDIKVRLSAKPLMITALSASALTGIVLLWPDSAWASKAFSFKEEGFKFLNTLIVAAILYKLVATPLRNFLNDRREGIRKSLAEAEQARKEAERQLEEQRGKVADLEAELGRVRERGNAEREAMRGRLEAEQETQAQRLLDQTRNTIELEMSKARAEIQNQAARLALQLAEDMLKKEIGPQDQERFVEDYLAKLNDRNGSST